MAEKRKINRFAIGVASCFAAINAVGIGYRIKTVIDSMKRNEGDHNQMNAVIIGSSKVEVKPEVQNLYVTCMYGSLTIDLEDVPANEILNIDLCTVLGKVTIKLPKGANVIFAGTEMKEKLRDKRADVNNDETTYIVYINRKSAIADLAIIDK